MPAPAAALRTIRLALSIFGWAYRAADGEVPVVDSVRCHYEGDRSCVRAHAVAEALGRIALVLISME